MVKSPSTTVDDFRKGRWSTEEIKMLGAYVLRYGHWNWTQFPKFAGLARNGNSCRQRWLNHLRPGIKRGSFSEHEEAMIIRLHRDLGNRWSAIAARLPGRTQSEIKFFWQGYMRKKSHIMPINEPEVSNSAISYTVDQWNPSSPVEEMDSGGLNFSLYPCNVLPENESESSASVGNYSVLKRNAFFADQSQCSGERDSDFTDVNAFTRILREAAAAGVGQYRISLSVLKRRCFSQAMGDFLEASAVFNDHSFKSRKMMS